jgi:hypothetical protein
MAGTGTYIARGNQAEHTVVSATEFNIDVGSGTTTDEAVLCLPFAIDLTDVRAVYTVATDTTGAASANFKLGTTVGGNTLVAATALEVSKAAGAYTAATIAISRVAANTSVFIRHTGIAATEAGNYRVHITYRPVP